MNKFNELAESIINYQLRSVTYQPVLDEDQCLKTMCRDVLKNARSFNFGKYSGYYNQTITTIICYHDKMKLLPQCLHSAIKIFEDYLQKKGITGLGDYQKWWLNSGLACLYISSKMQRTKRYKIIEWDQKLGTALEWGKIFEFEEKILKILDYNVLVVTPFDILTAFCRGLSISFQTFILALYFLQLSYLQYQGHQSLHNNLSRACQSLYLACFFLEKHCCQQLQKKLRQLRVDQVQKCQQLFKIIMDNNKSIQHKIIEKYARAEFGKVSKISFRKKIQEDCKKQQQRIF